ncbi:MAG: DoxX family protein [Geminicoccaceae bacterium]
MSGVAERLESLVRRAVAAMARIPHSLIAFVARFSIAGVFWQSGQTKVENFAIDLVGGTVQLGWPRLGPSTVDLFRDEYRLPLIPPEIAAPLAAIAEHVFPALILIGLATRFSALALLIMTLVIQTLVYPGAWPTHGTWIAIFLYLMARGPGVLSVDHLIARHCAQRP